MKQWRSQIHTMETLKGGMTIKKGLHFFFYIQCLCVGVFTQHTSIVCLSGYSIDEHCCLCTCSCSASCYWGRKSRSSKQMLLFFRVSNGWEAWKTSNTQIFSILSCGGMLGNWESWDITLTNELLVYWLYQGCHLCMKHVTQTFL